MSIKKLGSNDLTPCHFVLDNDQAILLIQDHESLFSCLHIQGISDTDFTKLKRIESVKEVKFLGGLQILDLIKAQNLDWPEFSRELVIDSPTEVVYYPENGKVRLEKKSSDAHAEVSPRKKKVLIIDDSKTIQKILKTIIESSDSLEVMGIADRPSVAKEIIENETPDLITLDIHMPEMDGVEFLKTYLRFKDIPTVMISSVSINEGPLVMEALSNGAATYIQKPSLNEIKHIKDDIIEKLNLIAKKTKCSQEAKYSKSSLKFSNLNGLIAIGSSTGGTQALEKVFASLPDEIPPIVVVQHIPAVFSKALADRLNTKCAFTIKEAEDGEPIVKNTVYIAPGGSQFKVINKEDGNRFVLITDDPPVNRFKPSVDYLFSSIAEFHERYLVGVILTGMGRDGAKGLLQLKEKGANTIAQDESTSVVFGMPKEAINLGAAIKVSPLQDIAGDIVIQYNKKSKSKAA